MNGQLIVEEVRSVINRLQQPGNAHVKEANTWLTQFSKSQDAWECYNILLNSPPCYTRTFVAISLYTKVKRDLSFQLSKEQIEGLLQKCVQYLLQFSQEPSLDTNVCRYLCLSIAAIGLQINMQGVIQHILTWLNPIITTQPLILLELLTALPEECYNKRIEVTKETRDFFSQELSKSIQNVFDFLNFLFTQSQSNPASSPSPDVVNRILRCLERWIDCTDVLMDSITSHAMFVTTIESLNYPDRIESAAEILIVFWQKYAIDDRNVSRTLLQRILTLRSAWDAQINLLANSQHPEEMEKEIDICRAICRLITESAEATMSTMFEESQEDGQELLLDFLVACVRFPFQFQISRIPLKFFYDFSILVKQQPPNNNHNTSNSIVFQRIHRTFSSLLEVLVQHMIMPEAVLLGKVPPSDTMDDCRSEYIDAVFDCSVAIGTSKALMLMCGLLQREIEQQQAAQQQGQQPRWNVIEAVLYGAQAVADDVQQQDFEVCTQLVTFSNTLPDLLELKLTSIHLIRKLSAQWLRFHPQYITPQLSALLSYLDHPKLSIVAAKTMMFVCKNCALCQEFPRQELLTFLNLVMQSKKLLLESLSFFVEGLCYMISDIRPTPQEQQQQQGQQQQGQGQPRLNQGQKDAFESAMACIRNALQQSIQNNNNNSHVKEVVYDLEALTSMFRFIYLHDSSLLTQQFLLVQPLFQLCINNNNNNNNGINTNGKGTLSNNERIHEKICRCYRYIIKNTQQYFAPLVPSMTQHLHSCFQQTHYSCYVYVAAITTTFFIEQQHYSQLLIDLCFAITTTFFQTMNSLQQFENHPDLVEEFYYYIARVLELHPVPLLTTTTATNGNGTTTTGLENGLQMMIQAAVTGLTLNHKEAQKGILQFFEKLYIACVQLLNPKKNNIGGAATAPTPTATATTIAAIQWISANYSPVLMENMLKAIAGIGASYALDESHGCIGDVLWSMRLLNNNAFQMEMERCLKLVPVQAQAIAFRMQLSTATANVPSKREFNNLISDFAWKCQEDM